MQEGEFYPRVYLANLLSIPSCDNPPPARPQPCTQDYIPDRMHVNRHVREPICCPADLTAVLPPTNSSYPLTDPLTLPPTDPFIHLCSDIPSRPPAYPPAYPHNNQPSLCGVLAKTKRELSQGFCPDFDPGISVQPCCLSVYSFT